MTDIITHEELISKAFTSYKDSSVNYGLSDSDMVKKMQGMSDSVLWGFIGYCKNNPKEVI